jgi:hypothetical protein
VSEERVRRWRLALGGGEADGTGLALAGDDLKRDQALERLYDAERTAGMGASSPTVVRWLGDIRTYFPSSVVSVMQQDALERLNLRRMLLEPELLASIQPDLHLATELIALGGVMPDETRSTARGIVREVVEDIQRRLQSPLQQAIAGALNRAAVTRRPRQRDIDWDRTIRRNLRHYQPEYKTVIPETLLGHARRSNALRDVVIAVDQSGSMAASVVYSSVFAAVMASIRSVETKLVVFDTSVVDLTDLLDDPVEVLFSTQLGGGTDINRAVGYCQTLVTRPADTIFVLISDLFEGGVEQELIAARLAAPRRRRHRDRAAGTLGQGRTRVRPRRSRRSSQRWARRRSPAPRTTSRADGRGDREARRRVAGRPSRGSPSSVRRNREAGTHSHADGLRTTWCAAAPLLTAPMWTKPLRPP